MWLRSCSLTNRTIAPLLVNSADEPAVSTLFLLAASSDVRQANDDQTDQRQAESEYASRTAQTTEGFHILLCQRSGCLWLHLGDGLRDFGTALHRARLIRTVVHVVVEVVAIPIVIASVTLTVVVGVELIRIERPLTVVQTVDNLVIVIVGVAGVAQARAVSVDLSRIADIRAVVLAVRYFVAVIIQLAEIATLGVYRDNRIRTFISAVVHAVFIRVQLAATASCVVHFVVQQCRDAQIIAVVDTIRVRVQRIAGRCARRTPSATTSAIASIPVTIPVTIPITIPITIAVIIIAGTASVAVEQVGLGGIPVDFNGVTVVTNCGRAVVV